MTKATAKAEVSSTDVTPAEVCMAYKQALATPEGHIVVADLMRRFGFSRITTYVPNEPERTILNEGQRTVLVHIGRMLDADPSEFTEPSVEE